jgi:DNA-binding MarR family transcriptional regulator
MSDRAGVLRADVSWRDVTVRSLAPAIAHANQLADDLVLDRSGLGHSLRPLEREGLIRLEKSSRDRRSTLVTLTDEGRERYARAFTLWQKAQDRYASVVGEAQADQLRRLLLEIGHDDQLA